MLLGTVYPVVQSGLLVITPNAGLALLDELLATLYLGRRPVAFEPHGSPNWDYFQAGGHVAIAFVIAVVGGLTVAFTRRMQPQKASRV